MAKVDEVLEELTRLGALGAPARLESRPETRVAEVEVEEGAPGAHLRDLRGPRMLELLDEGIVQLDKTLAGLTGLRRVMDEIKKTWSNPLMGEETEETEAEEAERLALETAEEVAQEARRGPVASESPEALSESSEPLEPDGEAYRLAREAAIRKVRGADLPEGTHDDDADAPFVGQVRAMPPSQATGESTVGTLGTRPLLVPGAKEE